MDKLGLKRDDSSRKTRFFLCAASTLLTAVIVLCVFAIVGVAPFGENALIHNDGQIQMIDLFCWYKDVLTGKASINYSFSKSLGGSNFAVFTYYLASPVALLTVFFDKSQACMFMDIQFLIKASLAALFMAYYLDKRFSAETLMRRGALILLAVSYALSQFMIAQSSNTMWLDGAYMLPLILLGCEKIVEGKKSTQFIITSALAIIFNWYSGLIDIMFSGVWLLFQIARRNFADDGKDAAKAQAKEGTSSAAKSTWVAIGRFAVAGICSALLSCALFLPTYLLLSNRTHGSRGLAMLKDLGFIGFVPNIITNYGFGMISLEGSVSIFAGSFVLIGVILLFVSGVKSLKEKITYGVFLVFVVMMFYWQPLVAVFSILRKVEAFWYRYSYLGSFALVVLAAYFYLDSDKSRLKTWMPFAAAAGFSLVVFIITRITKLQTSDYYLGMVMESLTGAYVDYEMNQIVSKVLFPFLIATGLALCVLAKRENPTFQKVLAFLLSGTVLLEMAAGQLILTKGYSMPDVDTIATYTKNETDMLKNISDDSFYRVFQSTYHSQHYTMQASYNEPMAYGYNSMTSFVSAPDEQAIMFLDRAGYKQHSETITVATSENLALDSLLSVKYVLLDANDTTNQGLVSLSKMDGFKALYENPYVLPVAFAYEGTGDFDSAKTHPAEYVNDLYRHLSGIDADVFVQVGFEETIDGKTFTYQVDLGDLDPSSHVLYANLPTDAEYEGVLFLNGEEYSRYSRFLAPSQVRVPSPDGKAEVKLVFNENSDASAYVSDPQFYALDLSVLKEMTDAIKACSASSVKVDAGDCRFEVNAQAGESLFISVPSEKGWTIRRNGKKVDAEIVGGAFMSIPLEEGTNVIEMHYSVPGQAAGIVLSILGLTLLGAIIILEKKHFSACPKSTDPET